MTYKFGFFLKLALFAFDYFTSYTWADPLEISFDFCFEEPSSLATYVIMPKGPSMAYLFFNLGGSGYELVMSVGSSMEDYL